MNADTILYKILDEISTSTIPIEHSDAYYELSARAMSSATDPEQLEDHCCLVARLMLIVANLDRPKSSISLN